MPTLAVTVHRVAYPPATATDASWFILITSHGTAKGAMAWRPHDNEALILEGEWTVYKGEREFKFSSARLNIPTNPRDQLHYVCERTSGLGPAAEQQIWDRAGANWPSIAEGDIPRLRGKVYANFRLQIESLSERSEEASVVAHLMGRGATMAMACAAWAKWAGQTLGVVNADPYRLAELPHYGFRNVDSDIRRAYGISDDDKRRIKAAVVYSLRRLTDDGSTVVAWEDLYAQTVGLLGGYADLVSDCTAELFEDGTLRAFKESKGVSLAEDFRAEMDIWEFVESTKEEQKV